MIHSKRFKEIIDTNISGRIFSTLFVVALASAYLIQIGPALNFSFWADIIVLISIVLLTEILTVILFKSKEKL